MGERMTRKKKRRKDGKRKAHPVRRKATRRRLEQIFDQADDLILSGKAHQAVELLKSKLPGNERNPQLQYYLGYAHAKMGDAFTAIGYYERSLELDPTDTDLWFALATVYAEAGLFAHAIRALRRFVDSGALAPMVREARRMLDVLDGETKELARALNIRPKQAEEAVYQMEFGRRTLHQGDYEASIAASRRALEIAPEWPPPANNLSLALFFHGQPAQAIATAQQVLSHDPDNIQARSNLVRYLAWTGNEAEAQTHWQHLQKVQPGQPPDAVKIAEAAAVLGDDEAVYQTLKSLQPSSARLGQESPEADPLRPHGRFRLGVAAANTGRRREARRLWQEALRGGAYTDRLPGYLEALRQGRPGPGWAQRFPYFHSMDMVPSQVLYDFGELVVREDETPPEDFRQQVDGFLTRYPQLVQIAEKMIWEEELAEVGRRILIELGTPEAHVALRRFGLSQAGPDEERLGALHDLAEAGVIAPGETVRVWLDGRWQEVQLRRYAVGDFEPSYTPEVAELLNEGTTANKAGQRRKAEKLFRRALELEPRCKEAYNNLAAIYSAEGKGDQVEEMLHKALEIDPLYVFPRCNLALRRLHWRQIKEAEEFLEPLRELTQFRSDQEMAFFLYTQAHLHLARRDYKEARKALEAALAVMPDYEPAQELLEQLQEMSPVLEGMRRLITMQQERDQRARQRLQAKLKTCEPALAEALSLYTKNALTGIARNVILYGGWTGLRKAELVELLVETLLDDDSMQTVIDALSSQERAALEEVLAAGGHLLWDDFAARYGDDLEESPYWEWHQPQTLMGRLRARGVLVEAVVDGETQVVLPVDLRPTLREML
jgi:tetratricopeptide (TPR) repeat protein